VPRVGNQADRCQYVALCLVSLIEHSTLVHVRRRPGSASRKSKRLAVPLDLQAIPSQRKFLVITSTDLIALDFYKAGGG
jgi:hypothetical protein